MPDVDRIPSPVETEITALTVQACRAAEQGDWDQVEQCVTRRGALLDQASASPSAAVHLVELDLRIQALGTAAQTGLTRDAILIAKNLGPAELLEYDRRGPSRSLRLFFMPAIQWKVESPGEDGVQLNQTD